MEWPTITQVNEAFPFEVEQMHDELPIPSNEEERAVMDRIFERQHDILHNNDW